MANKIICKFCAAEFDEMLPKCPYCGSTNYKGAEAEYLDKLEDVREDMEELEEVPEEETRKELRRQGRFLLKIFIVVGILALLFVGWRAWVEHDFDSDRNVKEDYLWKQENYAILNTMYEEGRYEEMVEFFAEADKAGKPVWGWEHSDFYTVYYDILHLKELYEQKEEGLIRDTFDYTQLLYSEWVILEGIQNYHMDEQEKALVEEYRLLILKNFEEYWKMSEGDYNALSQKVEENGGWITMDNCKEYVEKWLSEKE